MSTASAIARISRPLVALGLIFALNLSVSAQQAPAAGWSRVQALPAGTTLRIQAAHAHTVCILKSDDAEALTCVHGGVDITFQQADVRSIKIPKRGRSALIGAIPGTVLMAGAGIALKTENCAGQFFCGLGAGLLVGLGAVLAIIGASVGGLSDFAGPTIYKRP